VIRGATIPEPSASPEAPGDATRPARAAAFRRELGGTAAIVLAIAAVIASGWIGSQLLARSTATIGPGVTADFGPGWADSRQGPTNVLSLRRPIDGAELVISPTFDGTAAEAALAGYRDDVFANEVRDPTFERVSPHPHPAGTAILQRWTATEPDGDMIVGELVVVASGSTAVVLDARWVPDEDPGVIEEIRRAMDSVAIEPLQP
jgi:hypothetical protein